MDLRFKVVGLGFFGVCFGLLFFCCLGSFFFEGAGRVLACGGLRVRVWAVRRGFLGRAKDVVHVVLQRKDWGGRC